MLYDFKWLQPGKTFPPATEEARIVRYIQNAQLFDGDHFADPALRRREAPGCSEQYPINVYLKCAERISQVIGNFEEVISFPTLLNYQRLMSLKMADLVCGEYPTISGATSEENAVIRDVRDSSGFDEKLYSTVIDISRYGDAIWRIYKDYDGKLNFTCWDPTQWYPIVSSDGTNTIIAHCLCWLVNVSEDEYNPDIRLKVQIHRCNKPGEYEMREYRTSNYLPGTRTCMIADQVSSKKVPTGLNCCAVQHLKAYTVTNSVYGYDDYVTIDSILAEIMTRVGQIALILDKHADPNITGPTSMLDLDPKTGEYHLHTGKFFAVSPGEDHPEYMTWDGKLTAAFKQLEFLVNQLYILSEMGAALLGAGSGEGQAISGTAMRFKMVNPLAKARRISNSLTLPVRKLFECLSMSAEAPEVELPIPYRKISVFWADGLPDDPRENVEICKLATGAVRMMPLEKGIMEYFGRSNEEAKQWIEMLQAESEIWKSVEDSTEAEDPNHPGPQDGTGVDPTTKGSTTGLNNFHGLNNGGDA